MRNLSLTTIRDKELYRSVIGFFFFRSKEAGRKLILFTMTCYALAAIAPARAGHIGAGAILCVFILCRAAHVFSPANICENDIRANSIRQVGYLA